jgi:exodeoxyribonuclease V alpha subunit
MNDSPETISGLVNNITFENKENGYKIAKLIPDGGRDDDRVAVRGMLSHLQVGETVRLRGEWVTDPKWGRQFEVASYESVLPASTDGIKRFLSSKYLKGIGEVTAGRIVDTFGSDTLRVLDEMPERLSEVPKLNKKQRKAIIDGWATHHRIREVMIFLRQHEITENAAARIYEKYGEKTVDTMRSNPYKLIADIRGIGFKTADDMAGKIGIAKDSPDRIRAGILHCLEEASGDGHVSVPLTSLVETAAALMDIDADAIMTQVGTLRELGSVVLEEDRIYGYELWEAEREVARRLIEIVGIARRGKRPNINLLAGHVEQIESHHGETFADGQRNAVIAAARDTAMVITGGPGTGKTTTVRGIIDLFDRLGLSLLLCAPTGRAAKRLAETSGREAKTIHRLLEFNPHHGHFLRDADNPLNADAVIVDEASMVDIRLMADFLRAVRPETTLVIVGDVDQLPSIGPGSVLRDIIDSGTVPVVRLTEIFRQAAQSRIIQSAHRINHGDLPHLDNRKDGDFFFISCHEPPDIAGTIVDMVARRLPASYGFDPVEDIQVLAPMHKGDTGVATFNEMLRERLNPAAPGVRELRRGFRFFREGDKVMQVRNNYDKLIFNGDIGRITRIMPDNEAMTVRFDESVDIEKSELEDIVPAYAVSVHKSQGSEFPCIVTPVTTQHFIMLKRNLIYTAVTRAKQLAVLIGDTRALAIAVKNDQVRERHTTLADRLKQLV